MLICVHRLHKYKSLDKQAFFKDILFNLFEFDQWIHFRTFLRIKTKSENLGGIFLFLCKNHGRGYYWLCSKFEYNLYVIGSQKLNIFTHSWVITRLNCNSNCAGVAEWRRESPPSMPRAVKSALWRTIFLQKTLIIIILIEH